MAVYYAGQVTDAANGLVLTKDNNNGFYYWDITVPTGGYVAASIIVLALIPAGKRVIQGLWGNTAGGAAATAKIQDYLPSDVSATGLGLDSRFGTLTDMTSATSQTFANTVAKGQGTVFTVDKYLAVLTAAQTIQAGAQLTGFVQVL